MMGGGEMAKKNQKVCCSPVETGMNYCKVESIISIDERGQMILPKKLRDRAKIRAGDRLAIVSWDKGGGGLLHRSNQGRAPGRACERFSWSDDERHGYHLILNAHFRNGRRVIC